MPELVQTRLHRIYLVERWGDTLVVAPRGDAAGFSITSVNTEMAVVNAFAESGECQHLVVDLSGGNYFGSVVLGAIVQLGNVFRQRGGRIGLCGASRDMQDVLRLMKLDQMWELFHDRAAALRAIATIPLSQKIWARRRTIAWLLGISALALGIIFMPRPNYGKKYYLEVSELWREVEARREFAGVEEWSRLEKKVNNRLGAITTHLKKLSRQRGLKGAEPFILYAIRDYWPELMDRNADPNVIEWNRILVQYNLRCAEAVLEKRTIPALPSEVHSPQYKARAAAAAAAQKAEAPKTSDEAKGTPASTPVTPTPASPQ